MGFQRRLFCSKSHQWSIKQVTKSNFTASMEEIKSRIDSSDFIAVSLQKTGSFSAPWRRVSPFDTYETAYLKAKHAAESFQVLQFAICPFSVSASKVTAYPYNFYLFPRDEQKIGMPSYSFSCQTSSLHYMAQEGFDFNTCIYDGLSYLSRAQESVAKVRMGNPIISNVVVESTSSPSVADTVFIQRVRSRVKHWKDACTDTSTEETLVKSLKKLVLGGEFFYSRPCMDIDVCSERQVQLVTEMLQDFADLVPLIIPAKGGGTQAVRVILTRSKDDKDLLKMELQSVEDERGKKIRGFREVIDLISASQKPVVSHNTLNDLTFIHSKFIAPLPPTMEEFMCSLRSAFSQVIDVNHLMKEISLQKKLTNISLATSYLKNRFFAPVEVEIPFQDLKEGKIHGHNVVRICELFAKLCYILKLTPNTAQSNAKLPVSAIKAYANNFNPYSPGPQEQSAGETRIWTNSTRKVSCENLVFLWGFRDRMSAGVLKRLLKESHVVFSQEFDVRFVEKSCAIVVFWQPGLSKAFLDILNNGSEICGPLREMVMEGMRGASYEAYNRACRLGSWNSNLADSLDKVLEDSDISQENMKPSELGNWNNEWMVGFSEL